MRLSDWRASAPNREAMSARVVAAFEPVLSALGAERDPHAWVVWGDDPHLRYTIFALTPSGLISCTVRLNVPGEGPRASARLIRWTRLQLGELGMETQGGHRILTFQLDQQIIKGVDRDADEIGDFATALFAGVDGRPLPNLDAARRRRPAARRGAAARKRSTGKASTRAGGSARTSAVRKRPAAPTAAGSAAPTAAGPAAPTGSVPGTDPNASLGGPLDPVLSGSRPPAE